MLRLIEHHHPTHLRTSYQHLATTLSTKNTKAAEMYYLKIGAFEMALNMYIENGMWEDALRVRTIDGPSRSYPPNFELSRVLLIINRLPRLTTGSRALRRSSISGHRVWGLTLGSSSSDGSIWLMSAWTTCVSTTT